jgi:phosphatidylglycerol:prolipoprotein diacylglycerol transferase
MYTEPILEITLYDVFFIGGLLAALYVLSLYTSKKKMPSAVLNFYLNLTVAAMAGGFLSAFLFQAVYNFFDYGVFEFKGITFLGGLIGGAAIFLLGYKLFAKEREKEYFSLVLNAAPCCIFIAHGLGRIGCFFAGCCHGIETESFLGVYFPVHHAKMYPTQLFEAAFLFVMFGVTSYLFFKDKKINLIIYLMSYGVFRFLIEFLRGDDARGKFIFSFLSPSQTWSIVMILIGGVLLYFQLRKKREHKGS